jgi:hypothetical protein
MKKFEYICLIQLFFCTFCFSFNTPLSLAGTVRDDFDSDKLNTDAWEVTKAGKGTYSIKDGQLLLESPGVPDGVILYCKQKIEGDASIECKMDPTNVDSGTLGTVGFTDGIFDPEPSPDFWVHWLAHFNIGPTVSDLFVDNYPGKNQFPKAGDAINFKSGSHVWRIEISGNTVKYFFDEKDVGKSDNSNVPRYFHISPDPYTSHYFGTVAIDYIEITGNNVKSLAVSPADKLATTWAIVKRGKK